MTKLTRGLIEEFCVNRNLALVPGIIIGMQEEDGAGDAITLKNCFKAMRNFSAHDPASFVSGLNRSCEKGYSKIIIDGNNISISFEISAFAVWCFELYLKLENNHYLAFIRTFYKALYPKNQISKMDLFYPEIIRCDNLIGSFLNMQRIWFMHKGIVANVNPADPYMTEIFKTNPKLFWRVAIPNYLDFVRPVLLACVDDCVNNEVLKFILEVAKIRGI